MGQMIHTYNCHQYTYHLFLRRPWYFRIYIHPPNIDLSFQRMVIQFHIYKFQGEEYMCRWYQYSLCQSMDLNIFIAVWYVNIILLN